MYTDKKIMHFMKLQGTGNCLGVIVLPERDSGKDFAPLAQKMCSHQYGAGTDGLMVVFEPETRDGGIPFFKLSMYNPNGSESGMCGNGIRCVVRALHMLGKLEKEDTESVYDFGGRKVTCQSYNEGRMVTVNMGKAAFDPKSVPVSVDHEPIREEIAEGENKYILTAVSMGNPHCIIIDREQERLPNPVQLPLSRTELEQYGRALEHHPMFPLKSNIEFVQILSETHIKVQVWERDAGITLACGSGACASYAAAFKLGYVGAKGKVELPGGTLEIEVNHDYSIMMTGPAEEIFEGNFLL